MAEPPAPKLDLKMLIVPAILLLSRQIDMKNEFIVQTLQISMISVAIFVLTVHFLVYSKVSTNKNATKIWVPPKPKPSLPFNLGPAPEPVKVSYN